MNSKEKSIRYNDYASHLLKAYAGDSSKSTVEDANFFLRKRYLITFLVFSGVVLTYILRVNLSIAIVEMTTAKELKDKNETYLQKPDFDWDLKTKGFVLSVFSIGYLFGPFGGVLGLRYGAATIFGFGLVTTALLTVLSPIFLRLNFFVFIFARILEGVFESFSMACVTPIFIHWSPPDELSRLLIFTYTGSLFGAAINYPLSGFLAFHYGWEAVFYITGGMVFVWYAIWLITAANDPITDRWIAAKERHYFKSISSTSTSRKEDIIIPWRKLLTSVPFWVLMNEVTSYTWSLSFLIFCLPLYIQDVFAVNVQNNGLISAIPLTVGCLGFVTAALLLDYYRNRGTYSKSSLHRVFIATGHIVFVIVIVYMALKANFVESILCFSLAKFFHGFSETSYYVIAIDMFGCYAGVVKGFTLTGGSVGYFLNPIVMGFIVSDHTPSSWNTYFLFLCVFNVWCLIIYYFFGSGEQQEWAVPKTNENADDDL